MSDPRREVLKKTIAVLLTEVGFSSASQIVIETLVEMLQSLLVSISQSTRDFSEHAGRTEPTFGDVILALASNGIDFDDLKQFAYRKRSVIVNLGKNEKQTNVFPLQKIIPLPPNHTYKRTAAYTKPFTDHEELRCKSALNRRGTELAYSKLLARTSKNQYKIFEDEGGKQKDEYILAMDPIEPSKIPIYRSALNPTDQIFDFEELEYYYQLRNARFDENENIISHTRSSNDDYNEEECIQFDVSPTKRRNSDEVSIGGIGAIPSECSSTSDCTAKRVVDNPFLKFAKQN